MVEIRRCSRFLIQRQGACEIIQTGELECEIVDELGEKTGLGILL